MNPITVVHPPFKTTFGCHFLGGWEGWGVFSHGLHCTPVQPGKRKGGWFWQWLIERRFSGCYVCVFQRFSEVFLGGVGSW